MAATTTPPKTETTATTTTDPASGDQPPPPAGAPEAYADWKIPEGYELDKGVADEASPLFKELNLTQEQGQKLVDFYAKHAVKTAQDQRDFVDNFWRETHDRWRQDMKSDSVLGKLAGSDGNFGPDSPVVVTVNRALDALQDPKLVTDFKDAMELTGAGNNPAFVKVLYALASKVTEGSTYASGNPPRPQPGRPAPGAALYPHLPSGAG